MQLMLASRTSTAGGGGTGPATVADRLIVNTIDGAMVPVLVNDGVTADPTTVEITAQATKGQAHVLPNGQIYYMATGLPVYLPSLQCDAAVPVATNFNTVLTGGTGSSVTATPDGFRIVAGPLGADNTPGADNAWAHLVSKQGTVTTHHVVAFDCTVNDASPGSSAGESMMLIATKGAGTTGFPTDPNSWTVKDGTTRYSQSTNTRGYRTTMFPGAAAADNRDQIRVRIFPANVRVLGEEAPNNSPGSFPFPQAQKFRCILVKIKNKYRFTYWSLNGTLAPPKSIFLVDGRFDDEPGPHWLVFSVMPGRDVTVENLACASLTDAYPSGTDSFSYRVKDGSGNWSLPATVNVEIRNWGTGTYVAPSLLLSPLTTSLGQNSKAHHTVAHAVLYDGWADGVFSLDAGSWDKLSIVPDRANRRPRIQLNADVTAEDMATPARQARVRYSGETALATALLGTVDINLVAGTTAEPPAPADGSIYMFDDVPFPTPITGGQPDGIYEVRTRTELANALNNVQPGEHIVLKADIISSTENYINVTRTLTGTLAKPIVIRADTVLGRKLRLKKPHQAYQTTGFNIPCSDLNFSNSSHIFVWGIHMEESSIAFKNCSYIHIYRCKFNDNHYCPILTTGPGPFYIGFNDVSVARYLTYDNITQSMHKPKEYYNSDGKNHTRRLIWTAWGGEDGYKHIIWRNYLHDVTPKWGAYTTDPYCQTGVYTIGDNWEKATDQYGWVVHHNRHERCSGYVLVQSGGNWVIGNNKYGVYKTKSTGSILIQNTFLDSPGGIDLRQGFGTSVCGDYFEDMGGCHIYCGDNDDDPPWNSEGRWNGHMLIGLGFGGAGPANYKLMGGSDPTPANAAAFGNNTRAPAAGAKIIGCNLKSKVQVGARDDDSWSHETRQPTFWGNRLNGTLGTSFTAVASRSALDGGDEIFSQSIPANWYENTWPEYWGVTSIPVSRKLTTAEVGPAAPWRKPWDALTQVERDAYLDGTSWDA